MTDKVAEAFSSILPKKDDAEPAADEAVEAPAPDAPAPEEAIAEDAVAEASAPEAAADEAPATTKKPSFLAKVTTILSPRKSKEADAEVEAEAEAGEAAQEGWIAALKKSVSNLVSPRIGQCFAAAPSAAAEEPMTEEAGEAGEAAA